VTAGAPTTPPLPNPPAPAPFTLENTAAQLPRGKKPVPVHGILLTLYPRLASLPCGRKSRNTTSCIIEHWHRPHVEASERLFFWTSDAAIQKRSDLLSRLPPTDVAAYDTAVMSIITLSTRQVYGAGLIEWIAYCDSRHVPEADRFPAEHHHLQAFIASRTGTIGISKLNNVLSAMALWHHIHELPWTGLDNPLTKRFKRNAIARAPADSFLTPRPPVTLRHLELLLQYLNISLPFDAAVWATACCSFWGVCRLGENTSPSLKDPNPSQRACRSTSRVEWTHTGSPMLNSQPDGAHWFIPWTKTTGFVGATIIISKWDHVSCPIRALQNHLLVNSSDASRRGYGGPSAVWVAQAVPLSPSAHRRCRGIHTRPQARSLGLASQS